VLDGKNKEAAHDGKVARGVADTRGDFIHVLPLPEAVASVPVELTAGRRRLAGGRRPSDRGRASPSRARSLRLVHVVPRVSRQPADELGDQCLELRVAAVWRARRG
jgi:hypothetical protein